MNEVKRNGKNVEACINKIHLTLMTSMPESYDDLIALYSQEHIFTFFSMRPIFNSKRMLRIYLKNMQRECEIGNMFVWNVMCAEMLIGQVAIFDFENNFASAQISYFLHPDFWGKGIGTHVIDEVSEYIFLKTNIKQIKAYVHCKNIASYRCLEKAGYKRSGKLKNKFELNGMTEDCYLYFRVKAEL